MGNLFYFCIMTKNQLDTHIDSLLKHHGLRKTAFRKEILSIFQRRKGQAISNTEIEDSLEDWDRITLYRTLKSFESKGLIHQAPDSQGITKYALCGHTCSAKSHDDSHAHFQCKICRSTWCVPNVLPSWQYHLPNVHKVEEVNILLNGICQNCA